MTFQKSTATGVANLGDTFRHIKALNAWKGPQWGGTRLQRKAIARAMHRQIVGHPTWALPLWKIQEA